MDTILGLMAKIRERPGIYLGHPSVNNLYFFLTGFAHARQEMGEKDFDFLAGFNQWVHDRFEMSSTQGWAKIIEFFSLTPAEEMALFWKLLDEYLAQSRSVKKKVS